MPEKPVEQLDFLPKLKSAEDVEYEEQMKEREKRLKEAEEVSRKKYPKKSGKLRVEASGGYMGWAGGYDGNPQDPNNNKKWRR